MCSYHDVYFTAFQTFQRFFFLFSRSETIEIRNIDRKIFQSFCKTPKMLKRQNGRRNQHSHLLAIGRRFEGSTNSDFCLPKTYIATDEPVHNGFCLHVFFYIMGRFLLVWRVFVDETCFQLILQIGVWREGKTFGGFSLCVEFY